LSRQLTTHPMLIKKIIDLILYSNLFIACCAVAMTWQTQLLLEILGIGCFFYLPLRVQLVLVLPALFSIAYVLPFLGKGRTMRLRDVDMVKIFLVAGVWAYVTVLLPAIEAGLWYEKKVWLMLVERSLFVFAITLPFDIRDLKVDKHNKVNTLPAYLGTPAALRLAFVLMMLFVILCYFNYALLPFLALSISAISTCIFIYFSPRFVHDYYFTGLMDGTMILQFLLCYYVLMYWIFM